MSPSLLYWNVNDCGSVYWAVTLPVISDKGLQAFPSGSARTHATLMYKARFVAEGDELWKDFWLIKNTLQTNMCDRQVSMIVTPGATSNTWTISPRCELATILDMLYSVIVNTKPGAVLPLYPKHAWHITWQTM